MFYFLVFGEYKGQNSILHATEGIVDAFLVTLLVAAGRKSVLSSDAIGCSKVQFKNSCCCFCTDVVRC